MDCEQSNDWRKKGKQSMTKELDQQTKDTKREPNWTYTETTALLNAVQQIQTKRGRLGFSFTTAEKGEIFRLFKVSIPHTFREKKKLLNKLKVLAKNFKVCNLLANRSGGGWDDDNHRPIAPSEMEYINMILAKGQAAKFLLGKNFPWYRQMETMVGGFSARGEHIDHTENGEQPIDLMMESQMSIQGSEQDSSDDPEDGNKGTGSKSSVQQSGWDAGTSNHAEYESSDGTFPKMGNSGSKRKSTNESSEPDSRAKRYKERHRKKKAEGERLADAGLEIANSIRELTKQKSKQDDEYEQLLERFDEFGIVKKYLNFSMAVCKDDSFRRKWFLRC